MIPVRNSIHRRNSNNIRGFRDIKHSTYSKRLLSGFGAQKKLSVRLQRPQFDGFHFADLHLPGGHLESKWIGNAVDDAMSKVLQHLENGGVFYGLFGNILAALYRVSRGSIIRFLILLLYRVVVFLLMSLYKVLWRILVLPLTIVALLMLIFLVIALL
jgi:hypothetical protein